MGVDLRLRASMYDIVVVGAGPAGLAAGISARCLGADVLIIEQGELLADRSQNDREGVVSGVGGAGLFSDGKFSFFPSATALWSVEPRHALMAGYRWLTEILASAGMIVPPFPCMRTGAPASGVGWHRKVYPSYYLPIDVRAGILDSLASEMAGSMYLNCRVAKLERGHQKSVKFLKSDGSVIAEAQCAILALGRLGSLTLYESLGIDELVFRRVELGVRIEQPVDAFVLSGERHLDPKLTSDQGDGHSWRTFCCCRNGQVVFSSASGLSSVSGRADCPPTGRSNVGILIRFTQESSGLVAWRDALRAQPMSESAVEPLQRVVDRSGRPQVRSQVVQTLGLRTASYLVQGLSDLADFTGMPLVDAYVHAPAIEGVGLYPRIGLNLRIPGRPIYVAGDVTGVFRGLTAALLSGFVVGSAAASAALARTF